MARPKRMMTAGLTFITALAIGFAMQYGDAIAAIFVGDEPGETGISTPEAQSLVQLGEQSASMTGLTLEPATEVVEIVGEVSAAAPELIAEDPIVLAAVEDTLIEAPITDADIINAEPDCGVVMTASAVSHAMVDITVQADCFANESLVMHHQGMMFSAATDDTGRLAVKVPALSEDAFFIAAFDNGEGAIAQVSVPTLGNYDRAVLQWQGDQAIHMHAREFGAGFGEPGHVTSELEVMGEMAALDAGKGGYLQRFGMADLPNALIAEVYTFPSGQADTSADVALSAEIEITEANCDRDFTAQSLQIIPGADTLANDLVMKMPACDTIGEFLVLKNMFEDLTLASR